MITFLIRSLLWFFRDYKIRKRHIIPKILPNRPSQLSALSWPWFPLHTHRALKPNPPAHYPCPSLHLSKVHIFHRKTSLTASAWICPPKVHAVHTSFPNSYASRIWKSQVSEQRNSSRREDQRQHVVPKVTPPWASQTYSGAWFTDLLGGSQANPVNNPLVTMTKI